MRRYIYIVILGILVSFTSCTMTDVDVDIKVKPSANSGLQFIGAAEDFDLHTVGTRADEDVSDSHISEMTLLIYKADGTMLPAVGADKQPLPSSHINIRKPNPTFLIEANKYEGTGIIASMEAGIVTKYYDNKAEDITACKIFIVANAYHLLEDRLEAGELNTIDKLYAALLETNKSMAMPKNEATDEYIGLPMIGYAWEIGKYENGERKAATFNLKYRGDLESSNSVATIPLKKLYSKICFTMQVNSFQYVQGGQIPEFKLTNVEVFNVPAQVRMGYQARDYVENYPDGGYLFEYKGDAAEAGEEGNGGFSLLGTSLWPSRTTTYHDSSDKVEFHFFMPEHKVTPYFTEVSYDGYPDNLPKDRRQYYKPKLVASHNSADGILQNSKIATFVRIHGDYTTHNGEILQVSYDIYLGQDEVDDFEVKRNQQLNNIITINGLTNHKDAYGDDDTTTDNISIDHRVQVTNLGYLLSMEREAILDSHFEVRPLDITLSPGKKMTIQIPEDYKSWLAMESDAVAYTGEDSPYVSNTPRRGVRKYFTTNLVSELNSTTEPGNGGTITIETPAAAGKAQIHRIWFYIDENPNVYDKTASGLQTGESGYTVTNQEDKTNNRIAQTMYRLGKVNFYLSDDDSDPDTSGKPNSTVNFQQWNLWRVWNAAGTRYYDIEHEEEYLNNYASDQPYKEVQDGMPYGLEGVQLSNNYPSLVVKQNISGIGAAIIEFVKSWFQLDTMADLANKIFADSDNAIHYDFYLSRDSAHLMDGITGNSSDITNKLTIRDYSGIDMNRDIATVLKEKYPNDQIGISNNDATIDKLELTDNPNSAFAYCYNKNRRNANGVVENIKWFLPAIDEIEEIAAGAYDEFDQVFQNKKYWSCQSAYELRAMNLNILQKKLFGSGYNNEGSLTGNYFIDDLDRARATSVIVTLGTDGNTNVTNITSNAPKNSGTQNGQAVFNWTLTDYDEENSRLTDFIKATPAITEADFNLVPGNRHRTDKCRVRAVYRSGTGTRAQ